MDSRLIYLIYIVLLTTGAFLTLRVIWALATQSKVRWRALAVFMGLVALMYGYYDWESSRGLAAMADARRDYARSAEAVTRIALPWNATDAAFFAGAKRAAEDVNATPVQVILPDGRAKPLRIEIAPFPYDPGQALDVAQQIARDPSIAGVIGHPDIDGAIQASATYDAAGLLYLAPTIRLAQLTEHGFPAVFRLSPSDAEVAHAIAEFADQNSLFNIVILSPRNEYGYDLFQIYKGEISALNTTQHRADAPHVRRFISYAPELSRFDEIITSFIDTATQQKLHVDLVVILGTSAAEAQLMQQMRRRNLPAPILCLPDLQDEAVALVKATPDSMAGTIYVLSYGDPEPGVSRLALSETATREVLAYDTVRLMATAWARTGSTESREAAISLRAMPNWNLGDLPLDFLPSGAVTNMPIRVEKIDPALGGQPQVVYETQSAEPARTVSQP